MSDTSYMSDASIEESTTQLTTKHLSQFLPRSNYACGGSVRIQQLESTQPLEENGTHAITIRWDSANTIEKLILPSNDTHDGTTQMAKLIQDTQPASFGFRGKDVIDETYRKASKLDPSAFSTNFCPYQLGIIDIIGQALLPRRDTTHPYQGLRAELYKLNIYEAPSGLFKPHVDTPRSDLQIGSLVVCLPHAHEGGQLVVRHQGHSITFDWGAGSTDQVQWAAFYSDCEHEVLQVTSGYRVTLTYNLFVRRGLGEIAGHSSALSAQKLPLYNKVKNALADPRFMSAGGMMGKYCSHAYAHSTYEGICALPAVLKGSDISVYEVFRSLGVDTFIRPILDHSKDNYVSAEHSYKDQIGTKLSEPCESLEEDECSEYPIYEGYPSIWMKINWLNAPMRDTENLQISYLAYGNQAEIRYAYSYCALLFEIKPYYERVEIAKTRGYSLDDPPAAPSLG